MAGELCAAFLKMGEMNMDAKQMQKAAQKEAAFQTQDNAAPVMLNGQPVLLQQDRYAGQTAPDSLALYREKTAGMKDTAEQGGSSGKGSKSISKEQEEKLRRGRRLTAKATVYTEEIHTQMAELRQQTARNDMQLSLRFLEQYRFTPQMFVSSEIRAHFKEYLGLTDSYKRLREHAENTGDAGLLQRLEVLRPLMQAFTHRMEVYCEQNRVSLSGEILAEKQDAVQLTREETESWYGLAAGHQPKEEEFPEPPEEKLTAEELELVCGQLHELIELVEKEEGTDPGWLGELYLKEQRYQAFLKKAELEKQLREGNGDAETEEALREIREDIRRIERRQLRMELGMPQPKQPETVQRTREEAISTSSDQKSYQSRDKLAALNQTLQTAGGSSELVEIIDKYVRGTRYQVGYTLERERLREARKAVAKALRQENSPQLQSALQAIESYFDSMTNGTLRIPENAEIRDFSGKRPEESGKTRKGSRRNALIRMLTSWTDQKEEPLFAHEPTINDLKQRLVSNCYMMAATAGLVEFSPELLKGCLIDEGDTVVVRLYEKQYVEKKKEDAKGTAETKQEDTVSEEKQENSVSEEKQKDSTQETDGENVLSDEDFDELMKEFEEVDDSDIKEEVLVPVYVRVSKEIPRIAGADALSAGALWMQMIEKACAFLGRNGAKGYRSLWYGEGGGFLERLLGITPENVSQEDPDALFEEIRTGKERGYVYNAGTYNDAGTADGLNGGHAYTVMGAKEMNGKKYVLLRNPYSTYSLQYQENGEKTRTGGIADISSDETYGQFYMEISEFAAKFHDIKRTNVGSLTGQGQAAS